MEERNEYLDFEGLKSYDKQLKEYINSLLHNYNPSNDLENNKEKEASK